MFKRIARHMDGVGSLICKLTGSADMNAVLDLSQCAINGPFDYQIHPESWIIRGNDQGIGNS